MATFRRAWSGTCTDGLIRDYFANHVAQRIFAENHEAAAQGYTPELVEDFLDRCDAIFAEHAPSDFAAAEALANEIETNDLYDLVGS